MIYTIEELDLSADWDKKASAPTVCLGFENEGDRFEMQLTVKETHELAAFLREVAAEAQEAGKNKPAA